MSKLVIAILTVGAFFYALWLVLCGRKLPDPARARGLRRRFILATLLFAGLLSGIAKSKQDRPPVMCYSIAELPSPTVMNRDQVVATLQAVWRTLDPERGVEFRAKLEAAAGRGAIRRKTADMLAVAFQELAYHKKRSQIVCYIPKITPTYRTRVSAAKQLKLLAEARKQGKIDGETSQKAMTALARDVELLHRMKDSEWKNYSNQKQLINDYQEGRRIPGDSATVAAAMIVEMEGGQVSNLTAAQRLATIKQRVEKLIAEGPVGNDWIDPALKPNLSAVLEQAGIIERREMVMCYDRAAVPVEARSEELKQFQQRLLDQKVEAGVLEVEIAKRVSNTPEPQPDYATEQDIRDYQKKVRRAVRMLYKHGELTSCFVRQLEEAADIEMIRFDSAKALRNDMGYHLRTLLWEPVGDEVVKLLEAKKLISKARNQRGRMNWFRKKPTLTGARQKQMEEFQSLLDGQGDIRLPEDGQKTISPLQIPAQDREYRQKMRRVCRALVQTKLVQMNRMKRLEELIGIPLIGSME